MTQNKISGQKKVGLQNRFLLGLSVILIVFSAFAAVIIYFYEMNSIEDEAFQKTEIVMTAAGAAREYVRGELRPRMYEIIGRNNFIVEAMSSSYVSRAIMDIVKQEMPDFDYRRVAINARNPFFEANDQERDMIRYFRENPDVEEWNGLVMSGGRKYFMRYQPVVFSQTCGLCHGNPQDAPVSIRKTYGDVRGFDNDDFQINALVSVGVPVDINLAKTKEIAFSVFGMLLLSVFFLFGMITFFFNRLVVQNLREVLGIFHNTFQDEMGDAFMKNLETREEIAELTVLARTMADHLIQTRKQLRDYADNLEAKVDERTRRLQESKQRLREQILDRNLELKTLNTISELISGSVELSAILPKVLEHSLKAVSAQGAGIYLIIRGEDMLELQCQKNAPQLVRRLAFTLPDNTDGSPAEPVDYSASICEAAYGHLNFFDGAFHGEQSLNLPLCCREKVLGVMAFVGTEFREITPELQELLFSIGRQVGITIESLQNLAELTENKDILQSVFDGITDLVALVDCNGKFKMVNRAYLVQYDLSLEDVIGQQVHKEGNEPSHPFANALLLLGSEDRSEKSEYVHVPDGTIYETHYFPILDSSDSVINVVCYAKDVTEQKNIEQRMYHAEKLLALGKMAAGVAHEINNPLGVILCYADILKEEMDATPQAMTDLEIIEKHARSCQNIILDLLDFARGGETVKSIGDLNSVIEEVITVARTQLRKENIIILTELSADLPPLMLDRDKMKQVLINLIINSAYAISGDGEIGLYTVYLEKRDLIQLIIEDNGCGIPKEIIDKIFDPFFTTKGQGKGTGLGLSLAYGIIRDHNGEIQVESELGSWTRFTLSLPVSRKDEESSILSDYDNV